MGKGESFERQISRQLSLWWSKGSDADIFWRNRTRKTIRTPNAERQLGDLKADKPEGMILTSIFNIELKTGYSKTKKGTKVKNIPWDLLDLIDGKQHKFLEFWEQTTTDAHISNRFPMLIFKRDYHAPVITLRKDDLNKFREYLGNLPEVITLDVILKDSEVLQLFNLNDFLSWFTPEVVEMHTNIKRK